MSSNEDYWGGWSDGQFDTAVFQIVEDPVLTGFVDNPAYPHVTFVYDLSK